jgi:ParB/RepB/Spo0J family partition protein
MARKNKNTSVASENTMEIVVDQNTLIVPVTSILADFEWNARSGAWEANDDYTLLKGAIEETGHVRVPLEVRPTTPEEKESTGKDYFLVAGFRRYRAASELGLASVPVKVEEMTAAACRLRNLAENCARAPLNTPDLTFAIAAMGKGVTESEIARKCGLSQPYVGKLQKIADGLHPRVFAAWRKATFKISVPEITAISECPRDEQEARLAALAQSVAKKGGEGKKAWLATASKRASTLGFFVGTLLRHAYVTAIELNPEMYDREHCTLLVSKISDKATPAEKEAIIKSFCAAVEAGRDACESGDETGEEITIDNAPVGA